MASLAEQTLTIQTQLDLVKPGYRTSEFWMTVAMHALTLLLASGAFKPGTPWASVAAIAGSALAQMRYTGGRHGLKSDAINQLPASTPAAEPDPSKGTIARDLIAVLLIGLLLLSGCTYAKRGDFEILRFGYDTKIGKLDYTRDAEGERLQVNDLNSKASAVEALSEAIKRIPVAK
jgi:hypothetical protein